jgi:hypothetical integral membrane protein (TIGR02206 family)
MFVLFGIGHGVGILITLGWAALLYVISGKDTKLNRLFSRVSGVVLLSFYFIFAATRIGQGTFDPVYHLPLQISNLILIWTGLSLLFNRKIWYVLTIFWALPGAIASVTFPVINNTFPHTDYIFFWVSHAVLLGFVVFLFHYRNFQLSLKDFGVSMGIFVAYIVLIYPLNLILGSNYGFLNRLPSSVALPQVMTSPGVYLPVLLLILTVTSMIILRVHGYLKPLVLDSIRG